MSQEQPRSTQSGADPIKYGDVFNVSDKPQAEPIMPQDAATMQAAENMVLGQTRKGGIAALMQSAVEVNMWTGAVKPDQVSHVARDQGVTISQANIGGRRVASKAVGAQVVGGYVQLAVDTGTPGGALDCDAITIGEALEASALSAGDKPLEHSDAAAIQVAEVATDVLPRDKAVTLEDADRVIVAEMRNKNKMTTTPGVVAESMAAAARLNQHK